MIMDKVVPPINTNLRLALRGAWRSGLHVWLVMWRSLVWAP